MLKRGNLTSLLFIWFACCYAQGNVLGTWPVGDPVTYMSFLNNGGYAFDTTGVNMMSLYRHSNATCYIADSPDSVKFQCNGVKIVDQHLSLVDNGDSLTDNKFYHVMKGVGTSLTQSVVCLNKTERVYWVFYYSYSDSLFTTGTGSPDRLYYAIVDMDANGGAGKVTAKKMPLYKGIMGDCRLSAVRHANGRDWWLVNHGWNNNSYHKFLVTPDTVIGPYIQQIGTIQSEPDLDGMAQFTLDGKKYASGCGNGLVNVMDFDRCSGVFSNVKTIKAYPEPPYQLCCGAVSAITGLSWSPSGDLLYLTQFKTLLQYDTRADSIDTTRIVLARKDSTYCNSDPFYTLYITPHNKIVISNYQGLPAACNYHIIESPDSIGFACNFQKESLYIPSSISNYTLPNVVNLDLGILTGSTCDTIIWNTISEYEGADEKQIRVFPNPADERVFIETRSYGTGGTLQITDAFGRIVYLNQHFDEATVIKVSEWQSGVYYWHLAQQKQAIGNGKLVVKH